MFIRPWLEALKSRMVPGNRLNKRRVSEHTPVQSQVESLEDKSLLAAFSLVTVIPNQGVFLSNGDTVYTAPTEVTLRFSPGEQLTIPSIGSVASPGAIKVVAAGQDGLFDDPDTVAQESIDDVPVTIGYIARGDNENEVIVRFASPLPDDKYQIQIQATAKAGTIPLATSIGDTLTPDVSKTYKSFTFNLDLGAQVESVVPQPVLRSQVFSPSGTIVDGDVVTVTVGTVTSKFELNVAPNNVTTGTNIRVDVPASPTPAQITTALSTAISTNFGAAVTVTGGGTGTLTVRGAAFEPLVTFTTTNGNAFTRGTGTLTQALDKVVVYFNKDQLNASSAGDPRYYRLIDTVSNAVILPANVEYTYNAVTGLSVAVLNFAAALTPSTYNLKVGQSTEPNDSAATAVQAGTVFTNQAYVTDSYLGEGVNSSANTGDVDFYRITTNAAGTITVTLKTNAPLDGTVTLLQADGTTVVGTSGATGVGGTASFASGALPAGTYYARVNGNTGTGGYNLKVQTSLVASGSDDNSSFATATPLGDLGAGGLFTSAQIEPQGAFVSMPQLPGGSDEPGHREIPSGAFTGFSGPEIGHGTGTDGAPSAPGPILDLTYSFPPTYGAGLLNQITPEQKEIIRTIFSLYSAEAGIQVREVASGGQGIVVGDIRVNAPSLPPDAAGGISGNPLIINAIFFANDNTFGGGFTSVALHEIGHQLGLGHSYDVPSVQGGGATVGPLEQVLTQDNDIIHLLRAHPNNSSDIDLYQFNVTQTGTLSAQTIAERLPVGSFLNSALTLYKQDSSGNRTVVARNGDFYSKDSGIDIAVTPGTYFIGVSSIGNENYDPSISNSGMGGRSQGAYQLKLDFTPSPASTSGLIDTTGQFLDGDHDGAAGGVYDTWFKVAPTIIVDKLAPAGGGGTLLSPFNTISAALTAATGTNSIVRIVGNGGADGNTNTVGDNVPYTIGRDYGGPQAPLADGATFQIPANVTVMIDAGALLKIHAQNIDVGSSSPGIVRSRGALQVLGTPVTNVTFTSWRDDASGSIDDTVNGNTSPADWGGIVFRKDSDTASATDNIAGGVFLNSVNHATIQYGGGQVSVDGAVAATYDAIDLETARPTLTNNTIRFNADNAISANPDSFRADDGRIGPDIHGNILTQNTTNGLFIRVKTPLGGVSETLNVIARFDDTDITHVITQNLILNGRNAEALSTPVSARLMIDPGTIVKLAGARIETGIGSSNLIAEGTEANPIRFTSQTDDRYGSGGTFDTKSDGNTAPAVGDWSGIFLGQTSTASLDHVSISYAGGASEIAGSTDNFNPIETLQATLRVTNSLFENNAGGAASTGRGGRGGNDSSTIFVRGAQPVLVDNIFHDNIGNVISINANSMQNTVRPDLGRSTGAVDNFSEFDDNYGPLVRLNKLANSETFLGSSTLGMNIRPEELTIESIWDDTDIAHVLRGTITSDEFHTYGGLTLQSSATASLVVKLQGASAGFLATGDPLEITDRIGGTVIVVGQPNFPVILTSLRDDSVSAGFKPNGFPQYDTNGDNNDGKTASVGQPGDWNSLAFDQYSNDTNVALVNETEPGVTHGNDVNGEVGIAQSLGNLAPNLVSSDENRRLGYEVHGFISPDSPGDVDVYSFTANSGTEIWADIDFTSYRLDSMIELLDSSGTVLARSLNSQTEQTGATSLSGTLLNMVNGVAIAPVPGISNSDLNPLIRDATLGTDFYTSNFHDAGFRAVLPGPGGVAGISTTYFLRVRSQPLATHEADPIPVGGNGLTSGAYQLQLRLKQVDDIPGSTVQYADIRYATNGIETHGLPTHSPLIGEAAEPGNDNQGPNGALYLGPLLQTDRNTFTVSGSIGPTLSDVDFYSFTVDYSQIQVIIPGPKFFPTTFDIDWADGLTRPDTVIAVYNENGDLIYIGRESDIGDDQPGTGQNQGQDLDDLTRGSLKTLDPFIGTVNLPAGVSGVSEGGGNGSGTPLPAGLTTYYVAVLSNGQLPAVLSAGFTSGASPETQRVRLEPINSIKRVVEDHIGFTGYNSTKSPSPGSNVAPIEGPMFNTSSAITLAANIRPFTLSDVNLFVSNSNTVRVVDPLNGKLKFTYNTGGLNFNDLDMRTDGHMYAPINNFNSGTFAEVDLGTGGYISNVSNGIPGIGTQNNFQANFSSPDAVAIHDANPGGSPNYDLMYYASPNNDGYNLSTPSGSPLPAVINEDPDSGPFSKLYRANIAGNAGFAANSTGAVGYLSDNGTTPTIVTATTGMQYFNGQLYGVSAGGQFYRISGNGNALQSPPQANPDPNITDAALNTATEVPKFLVSTGDIFNLTGRLGAGVSFVGLTDAPQNVNNGAYKNFLFALTSTGRLVAIDPANPTATQLIFDSNNDNVADADSVLIAGAAGATGLAFSPVDFNLWHPTEARSGDAGHGVNSTYNATQTSTIDNSRTPGSETVTSTFGNETLNSNQAAGGASMYFGLEEWGPGGGGNYYQYNGGGGQLGVGATTGVSQQQITSNTAIGNNYNVPGGTAGSLVTNSFNLEGYNPADKPTLYFNYFLSTEGAAGKSANTMRDAARVYVSTDNGITWDLIATNNSATSTPGMADAELPAFASASKSASGNANQQVQELFDTGSWRQARVDLNDYVGKSQVKLRFDFSTNARMGTAIDPATGLRVASDNITDPTYNDSGVEGSSNGVTNQLAGGAQNNTGEGFYIDDIIIGFAGRGEMVTASGGLGSTAVATPVDTDPNRIRPLLTGNYQLEIRGGEQYSTLVDPPTPSGYVTISPSLSINDRQTNGQTIFVGNTTQDGNTVTIYDGIITKVFEFNSVGGVSGTNILVDIAGLNPLTQRGTIAGRLAIAINSAFTGRNSVSATAVAPSQNSDRVDIYGAASVKAVGTPPATINLGSENDSIGFGYGNDYPVNLIANSVGGLTSGTNGVYTLSGTLGNSPQAGHPDSDFFQLNMMAGETITVRLTPTAITGTNYLMGILSGTTILSSASSGTLTFTAPADGTYFLGILGDDGNSTTSPVNPSIAAGTFALGDSLATAGNDTFTYVLNATVQVSGTTLPAALSVSSYVRKGDDNLTRTQGQFIIQGNQILNSANAGILVDDFDRIGNTPKPGAPLNLPVLPAVGEPYLVPGMYIQNNVISGFGQTGIDIAGDNTSVGGAAITPFVKVVNNTIVGNLEQVSPALLALGAGNLTGAMRNISFSEAGRNVGDTNPVYNFAGVPTYGNVTVSFGSYFQGQAATGGAHSTLRDSTPTSPLQLDPNAPTTQIFNDTSSGSTPVLSGNPDLNGPISVLFSTPVAAVALDGGFFDVIGAVSIEAFDANGVSLGLVTNSVQGYETFGLAVTDPANANRIKGISIYVTGNETADFSIDNLRFGSVATVNLPAGVGTGISVKDNISATLLNNAIVATNQAIFIGPASGTTVIDANLFQFNNSIGNAGTNNLQIQKDVKLFVDPQTANYYPASFSPLIDSARSSFNERATYTAIAGPIGIPDSPIIGPLVDRFGQIRAADPLESVFTGQPGLGENPTKDRGAVERIDSTGGRVVPVTPQDNDGAGTDLDPATGVIWIDASNPNNPAALFNPLTTLTLQLLDAGIGINDLSVNKSDFLVLENGLPLVEGQDYIFTYNQNTNLCIFTSVSTFKLDARYQIFVDNPTQGNPATPFSGITDFAGNLLQNNNATPMSPSNPNLAAPFDSSLLYFTYIITDGDNDAPSNSLGVTTLPAAPTTGLIQLTNEDTAVVFSSTITPTHPTNNAITVTDPDAFLASDGDPNTGIAGGRIQVTVSIDPGFTPYLPGDLNGSNASIYGTLELTNAAAITQLLADGGSIVPTGAVGFETKYVITGRIDDINNVLEGLTYHPKQDFPIDTPDRTVNIRVVSDDSVVPGTVGGDGKLGPPGNSGFQTATSIVPIQITPLNDLPEFTLQAAYPDTSLGQPTKIYEDEGPFTIPLANILAGGGEFQSLRVSSVTSSNQVLIPDANILAVTPTGSNPLTQPTSGSVQFNPVANRSGTATLTVTVEDSGLDGIMGNADDGYTSHDVLVTITPSNDDPLIDAHANVTSLEDIPTNVTLTGISPGILEFPGDDLPYPGQTVSITAVSSNPAFIPNPTITYVPGSTTAVLSYTPNPDLNSLDPAHGGTATITVTITDSGDIVNGADVAHGAIKSTQITFVISVTPVNDPPTVIVPLNSTILEDTVSGQGPNATPILLTGITTGFNESEQSITTIDIVSSNNAVIRGTDFGANSDIVKGTLTPSGDLLLTITPQANQYAENPEVTLTVTIRDSGLNGTANGDVNFITKTFNVRVIAVDDEPSFTVDPSSELTVLEDAVVQPHLITLNLSAGPLNETDGSGGAGPAFNQTLSLFAVSTTSPLISNPIIVGTNTLMYTTVANANNSGGQAVIHVTLVDSGDRSVFGDDNTYEQDITINILPVNDAPTLDPIADYPVSGQLLEDGPQQSIDLHGITAGPPNESFQSVTPTAAIDAAATALLSGGNPNLLSGFSFSAITGTDATLFFTPTPDQYGSAVVTVTITDDGLNGTPNGDINFITRSFVVTVLPVNDQPSFDPIYEQATPLVILEDAAQQTITLPNVTVGPANESGLPLNQTLTTTAVNLTPGLIQNVSVVGTNTILFTPVLNANHTGGIAQIQVTLTDTGNTGTTGDDNTYTQILYIDITPVNDPPTLDPIANQPPSGLVLEDAAQQSVALHGITAGPADEIGQNLSATAAIDPVATALLAGGNPNLVTNLNVTIPANGDAILTYTPVPDEFGTATIVVTVFDDGPNGVNGAINFFTRTFTITVTPVNDAPSFDVIPAQTVFEDAGLQTITLTGLSVGPANEAAAPLNQTLILSAISLTPNLLADPVAVGTNTLNYTTLPNANGQAIIRVTLRDNGGIANGGFDSYTQDVIINITPVDDAPTLDLIPNQPAAGLLLEDAAQQTINLSGITAGPVDESGQSLSITAAVDPAATALVTGGNPNLISNLIVSGVSGTGTATLKYTPVPNEFGTVTVKVTVTDSGLNGINGAVDVYTQSFTITVTPVNDAPSYDFVFPTTILEDAPQQTITLTGLSTGPSNESNQTLVLSAVSMNPTLIGNPAIVGNNTLRYVPLPNATGTAVIRVTLSDNGGTSNGGVNTYTQDIVVNLTPVNDAPTLAVIADQPATGFINEDSGQQTVNLTGITAGPADESTQTLTVTATVTGGNLNLINNLITSSVSGTGTATLKYIPTPNEFGTATVTVTVSDSGANGGVNGDVNSVTRTFTITVTPSNDQPTLTALPDQVVNEDAGQQVVGLTGISVGAPNEAPPQTASFSVFSDNPALIPNDPAFLSVVYNTGESTGQLLYKSADNAFGVANITLTLKDTGGTANGGVDTIVRTFKITVNEVPDNPTNILLSGNQVFENRPAGTLVGMLSTSDVDLPNDNFSYSIVSGTGLGVFQINGNQLQTTQPLDFEAVNSYSLMIRTRDRFGLTFDKQFNIAVVNLNDAPTLDQLSPVIFNEDPANPVVINLTGISAGFNEVQSLTITATSDNPNLFANPIPVGYSSPSTSGTLLLSPIANANGTATITITVQDGGGTADGGINTITRTFTVTVNPVNDSPTNISLTNNTIPEIAAGTPLPAHVLVGQLASVDPDNPASGNTFSYSLVDGGGASDNARFSIVNDQLFAERAIDFDTQPDYTVRIRSTDNGSPNAIFDKVFTIRSTNVNEPATGISTSANASSGVVNSIPENQPAGAVVGALVAADPDAFDSNSFSLVLGAGSTDNALFKIVNGQLIANVTFDFEVKSSYTIRVRAVDSQGLAFETPVTISITNADEAPVDIGLSNNTVPEDIAVGASVGTLTSQDVDHPETFTYTLAAGAGSTDNARFSISGDKLIVATALNYEERLSHSYSVRVRSTDIGGLTFEKVLTINVTDVNEAPTDLTLSPSAIDENLPVGATVGTLIPVDQDPQDTYTFQFVNGANDNALFQLNGNKLQTAAEFDFETRSSYTVRIQGTDSAGHQIERQLTITVNDKKDPPVITLSGTALSTTGHKPVVVDANGTITDIDSPNFDGGKLKVFIQAGEQTGDTLGIKNEKKVRGSLTLKTSKGKTVLMLGKQQIGTISGGVRGIPLVVQFGSGITQDIFQRVIQSITFRGKPFAAPRQVAMQGFDELGLASKIAIRNVNVN